MIVVTAAYLDKVHSYSAFRPSTVNETTSSLHIQPAIVKDNLTSNRQRPKSIRQTRFANSTFILSIIIFYTVSQKNCAKLFLSELRQCPPILILFGRKMAKRLKLCQMHSFSTSPNSRHHTTVLNADVWNCYTMLKAVICSKHFNDSNSTSKVKCGLFSRIMFG